MYRRVCLIYTWRDWLCWMEDREKPRVHKYRERIKRLKLWWLLYVTSLPEWHVQNIRQLEFCWTECTCKILTVCKKMSVGHICNMVLGGLENICTEWVFTYFFSIKQTVSTSSLVCLKFIFNILFYFTYCIILIWWCCQLCANVGWQNFVGLCLSMEFVLCYISGSRILRCLIDFCKICALII